MNDPDIEPVELPGGFEERSPSQQVGYLRAVLEQVDLSDAEMLGDRAWSALDDLAVELAAQEAQENRE